MTDSTTLGDALPKEMARVRELIPLYLVEMIRVYQSLKEYSA